MTYAIENCGTYLIENTGWTADAAKATRYPTKVAAAAARAKRIKRGASTLSKVVALGSKRTCTTQVIL